MIWARRVSVLCNPLLIGVPVVFAIGVHEQGGISPGHVLPAFASIGIMCGIPLVYTLALLRIGIIHDFHISDRKQRIYLFPVLLICFVLGALILYHTEGIGHLVLALLGFGVVNCFACALISIWFKISLHCAGLAALGVGTYYSFGFGSLLPAIVILALTAWSRIRLDEHTVREVVAGSLFGGIATGIELYATIGAP